MEILSILYNSWFIGYLSAYELVKLKELLNGLVTLSTRTNLERDAFVKILSIAEQHNLSLLYTMLYVIESR